MNSNPQPLQGIGYVYVVRHANARGLTKIGLTRHPQKREEQLGGDDCEVLCRLLVLRPERVEAMLHSIFSAQRVPQSEWFDLDVEQIREACEAPAPHLANEPAREAPDPAEWNLL